MVKQSPRQNPKLLAAKELFHVKLPKIMDERGLKTVDLTLLIPGLSYQSAYDWVSGNKVPEGPYTAWLIQVLRVEPAELFGPPGGDPNALVAISTPKGVGTQIKLLEERIKVLERIVEQKGAKVAGGTCG
ncbi:hypothetical protein LCGC14_1258150 [marine sediment metagenome]|uniref:HTH cro/C1-type domain-containing protein n=1 Tax=marine sediment metagenome TaxID=412755 RepID=A0A0F9L1F4_9ZZZZ